MTVHIDGGDRNPAYATYVGRVGALAVALGIGAAMATGHGLGLGVAYATEGDSPSDTSQDNEANDNDGDGTDNPSAPPSGTTLAPSGSSQPRSPLARIASVPKMIFNATGGAQRSSAGSGPKQLPKLQNVIEDVTSAITGNLPKAVPSTQGSAGQSTSPGSASPQLAGSGSNNVTPTVSSVPETVTRLFHGPTAAPSVPRVSCRPDRRSAPNPGNIVGNLRQALVNNGQQDVVQPSAALVQTPTTPPPVNPVGVVTRLLTVAFSGLVAPGPAAPTDPPLLLGVLAWARREFQLNFFNRTPNAIPDAVTTSEDVATPVTGNVLTNDRQQNPDGATEKLTVTDARTQITDKGTLVLNADGSYTYTPKPNANGQDVFTYTVSDEASRPHIHGLSGLLYGGGHTDTGTLTINITPDNDAPTVANPIDDQTTDEDAPYSYTIPPGTFTDIDTGDTLTYTTSTLPAWLSFDGDTRTFTGTPTNADVGDTTITVTATDLSGETATDTFTLAVANTNDAPTLANPIDDQTTDEDAPYTYTIPTGTFTDIDTGDTLTYTTSTLPAWLSFDGDTRTFTGTPTNDDVGDTTITVTATDLSGETATDTFTLAVANTNDAPTLANPIDDQTTDEDAPYTYTIPTGTFTDIDTGDTLTYTTSTLPAWLSFDGDTRTFTGTPTNDDVGDTTITVTATDLSGETATDTFTLTVNPQAEAGVISVGNGPYEVVFTPDGSRAYVSNFTSGTLQEINLATNSTVGPPIAVGSGPVGIVFSSDGKRAYVPLEHNNAVAVVDTDPNSTTYNQVVKTISVGSDPIEIALSKDGNSAYVTNIFNNSVSVIDTDPTSATYNQVTKTIPVGGEPFGIAITPDGTRAYVANRSSGTLSVINTTTNSVVGAPIPVGSGPNNLAVNGDGTRVYVANRNTGTVSVVDTDPTSVTYNQVVQTISVGGTPYAVAVAGDRVFVTNELNDTVTVINATNNTVVGLPIPTGNQPLGVTVSPDGNYIYVANFGGASVSVIAITPPVI